MQSKTLLLNKGLLRHFSNNILILSVINLICSFILIPFSYINRASSNYFDGTLPEILGNHTDMTSVYFFGTMIYALLCGVLMTYTFKNESASDFFHSLPFKRKTMLLHIVIAFIIHVVVVLLIIGSISALLMLRTDEITGIAILKWMGLSISVASTVFFFTLLVGQWVNNYINHILVTVFLLILPAILNMLIQWTYAVLFKGFGVNYEAMYSEDNIVRYYLTLPLSVVEQVSANHINWSYFGVVMLVGLICLVLAFISYKLRDNENVKQTYQKYWVEVLIGSLLTITGVIFAGWVLSDGKRNFLVLILIYIVAFVVIYFVFQMLNQRVVRIQMNYKTFAMMGTITALAIMAMFLNGKWQEQKTPSTGEIAGVLVRTGYPGNYADMLPVELEEPIQDQSYIKKVVAIQKELIKNSDKKENGYSFNIEYQFSDAKMERSYYGLTDKALKDIRKLNDTNRYGKIIAQSYEWDSLKSNYNIDVSTPGSLSPVNNNQKTYKHGKNDDIVEAIRKDMSQALYSDPLTELSQSESSMYFFPVRMDNSSSYSQSDVKISPYNKNLIQLLIKDKMIKQPNEIFSLGNFYLLTQPKDKMEYVAFGDKSFKKAKPLKMKNDVVRKALDKGHASINGKYPYAYIDKAKNEYVLFYMDVDLTQ